MEEQTMNQKAGEIMLKYGHLIRLGIALGIIATSILACAFLWNYYHNIELIKEWAGADLEQKCLGVIGNSFIK